PKRLRLSEGGVELPLLRQIEGYFRLPEGEGAERRRFTRVPYGDPVAVRRMHEEESLGPVVLGRGRDLSLWGIGLAVSEAFQPGDELILSFHPYPEQSANIVRILGEVRHARAESDQLWFIGCT